VWGDFWISEVSKGLVSFSFSEKYFLLTIVVMPRSGALVDI
jgi:hypothetical protein